MNNIKEWAGPRLLVPITVDALVVTENPNATKFSLQSLELREKFDNFKPLSPELFFDDDDKQPEAGIHLNWALPDGMTKGMVDESGRVAYPFLPNRWLVTRFSPDSPDLEKTWVVMSDMMSDDEPEDQKIKPQFIQNKNGVPDIKFIGRAYNLEDFNERSASDELVLTAIGNSDPLFTAYGGNNLFVFSFIDRYYDTNAHNFSYMVAGWFSNGAYDILDPNPKTGEKWRGREGWIETMNRLQWAAGTQASEGDYDLKKAVEAGDKYLEEQKIKPFAGDEGKYCARTLCHGLVFDVKWPGMEVQPDSSVPVPFGKTVPYISAGNAATDCLSAFLQWQLNYNHSPKGGIDPDDIRVEKMMEAFSHKMLNQPGTYDTPELDNVIHQSWFGKMPGGKTWVAEAKPKAGQLKPDESSSSLAILTDALANELAALNQLQQVYDRKNRQLVTLQRQLYADWLKWNMDDNAPVPFPVPDGVKLKDVLEHSAALVNELKPELPVQMEKIVKARDDLKRNLGLEFELKEKPANDFYRPGDPVLLVNNAKRSYKRGEDLIYSEYDDYLFTRFSGQFITCLNTGVGLGSTIVYARDIFKGLPRHDDVPSEVQHLMFEAYLLNPTFARQIAQAATPSPTEHLVARIAKQQTLIWNHDPKTPIDQRTLQELAGFNPGDDLFRIPSKIGVWKWEQPWTPLYLEWDVTFYPNADINFTQWNFDGRDFSLKHGVPMPDPKTTGANFMGRSILTPKEAITVQARLKEFINDFHGHVPPEFAPLAEVVKGTGNWDVLSQTLTGFSQQLLQWDIEQFGRQPLDKYADGVGNEAHGLLTIAHEKQFYPVRAGLVFFNRLWIVDDFGQVYNLKPDTQHRKYVNPIPAIGVRRRDEGVTHNLPDCFQLPPRLVQGSRLNLRFMSAENDNLPSNQSAATTPVCGWLLPNHLNHSVMVYNKTGILQGEIMLMGPARQRHAQWIAAPLGGTNTAGIPNRHLKSFVLGLLGVTEGDQGTPESGRRLKNFMQAIDETLWTVDPLGERNNQSLSVLVGRPIAVVRAAMDLEVYGNIATNLAWEQTTKQNEGQLQNYNFPVQVGNAELGQDGVMGYFPNNDYTVFNTVHDINIKDKATPAYVTNTFANIKADKQPVYLTILLDPRGDIHCSTGILPVLQTRLPELYVGKVLDDMLVEFKTGPLIVDKEQWWLPLPAGAGQRWSWLEPPALKEDAADWRLVPSVVLANAIPQLSGKQQTLIEGRLRLTGVLGGDMMILAFEVVGKKPPYTFDVDAKIMLSWATQGAESATLTYGTGEPFNVPVNQAAFSYTVTQTRDIKLTLKSNGKTVDQIINIVAKP